MASHENLAGEFEASRRRLRALAYRMLGSQSEAEDAVQEAWLRLGRADTSEVGNLGGWLTTVVARVCLDMLRSRKSRREEALDDDAPEPIAGSDVGGDPERDLHLADSIGMALLVVLETLAPAERVAFVLHDMFDLPFDEIAPIVGRSPTAARQLASRARRRVQGADTARGPDRARQREIVGAFLAASRGGDLQALLAVLDPEVVLRADGAAIAASAANLSRGAPPLAREIHSAAEVAKTFAGRAGAAQPALIDGVPGLVFAPGGQPRAVFAFTIAAGRITGIDVISDPQGIAALEVVLAET